MDSPDVWIPMFTKHFADEQILKPGFAITFDHCKLCDAHVDPGEQKEHLRAHKRELKSFRSKQKRVQATERAANLRKARKARAA